MAVTKLGILVGEDKWTFFRDIYDDLASHYQTDIYESKTYNTPLLYGRLNRWAFRQRIRSVLRHNDICFFEWASELLVAASHMPKRCAIVTRLHSFEMYEWAHRINWEAVDRVILVSKAMQQIYAALYPQHAEKTRVVYSGKRLDTFKPLPRQFSGNIGMLCNLTPIKRVYELILTLHELKQRGCQLHLHLGGEPRKGGEDQRYYASMQRAVEKLGLQEQVTFYGYVPDPENWLRRIDIYISNSFWEGQQVALIEAMATGCYCLSHFWAGAEEVLPSEFLFSTESVLQQKIIEYCEMPEEDKMEHQARMRRIAEEKFDIEFTISTTREIIDELCRNGAC